MKIKELLEGNEYQVIKGSDDLEIEHIACHTGKVKKNSLFICINGRKFNGHDFIGQAINKGATAILVQDEITNIPEEVTLIKVANTRAIMPKIANIFFGDPTKSFNLVGITGTNGKTSVSIMAASILEAAMHKVGVIGTIGNRIGQRVLDIEKTTPTTPDSIELGLIMKEMKREKVNDVIMEVSSMALELHRVDQCDFDIGVFTNLSQDHLDDHKTMENYKKAKLKLFSLCKRAVVNLDDPVSRDIIENAKCDILTYGINSHADIYAKNIDMRMDGISFIVNFKGVERKIDLNIPGKFSIYNALAAFGICHYSGLSIDEIVNGFQNVTVIPGRFDTITSSSGYSIIIDYAHTPTALQNILETIKEFVKGKIITVFGCGGDRDKTKRPIMGEIAGIYSDYCIITSDNPRTEDPLVIIDEIETGIGKTKCKYDKIEDRKTAIYKALETARKGDVIVIAGKGHEDYQIFKDETIYFNDKVVVMNYLIKQKLLKL